MKKLTRIRLINWHYFVNETINVNGSFLVTGENTSGKSTILDAIQLVLTTNTRKFNTAANEKSKRDLKGYVRCKTGDEENVYLRKGCVITYVALEFYEEKRANCFTLGIKVDSPDEESKVTTKWFSEECKLEGLSFITDGRPSITEEFRKNDRKVQLISQVSEAKLRFGRRLGNLEDRFFDMIPKSLAFKPMDKVKDFINKFILSEKKIEVSSLRKNIAMLKEFEELMEITKQKIERLEEILSKNNDVEEKERDIKINEILIKKAEIEETKEKIENLNKNIHMLRCRLIEKIRQKDNLKDRYDSENKRLINLKIAHQQNEITKLISDTEHRIEILKNQKNNLNQQYNKLELMISKIVNALSLLAQQDHFIATKDQILQLKEPVKDTDKNNVLVYEVKNALKEFKADYNDEFSKTKRKLVEINEKKVNLEKEIKDLKNKKLTYPVNTTRLKEAIEDEFKRQGIDNPVRIFSDLLEISDSNWQNAIEGYLNSQRFYIIVEPKYYSLALHVYHKMKKEVHTVGLVNTGKLDVAQKVNTDSLAYLVMSNNRYAKAYANYLLNRVIRCNHVDELKEYKVAITADCMLYQNFAVRKISDKIYKPPYIGAMAYKIQLELKEEEHQNLIEKEEELKVRKNEINKIINAIETCNMDTIEENINTPNERVKVMASIEEEEARLEKAKNNPNYIEIQMEIDTCQKSVNELQKQRDKMIKVVTGIEKDIENSQLELKQQKAVLSGQENVFERLCAKDASITVEGLKKFYEQIRLKSAGTIKQNFSRYMQGLENKKNDYIEELITLQSKFCSAYDCDLGTGVVSMDEYRNEYHKLVASEIIKYEDQLNNAKNNCELEFKESFLARLKENIENAKLEFKFLNKALKGIYYGEDSYKFDITYNRKKESLYQMIMSDQNIGGFNLWTSTFEEEYQEEMNDLFDKLTAYDDLGDKVIEEYTDYRSYLDYDIIVEKKDGTSQCFSNIYGEKSGGETQTPYYVAIAASFVQLYKLGDTIRIIMLDEAFDKMDDNRISSMMDFFNKQNFQIILATPPSKMEVIGEKVDTILMTMREGSTSIVEEYDL